MGLWSMTMTLSISLSNMSSSYSPGVCAGFVDLLHQGPVECIIDQSGLARARDAGDDSENANGNARHRYPSDCSPGSP